MCLTLEFDMKLSRNQFPVPWRYTAAGADWYSPALQPGNPQQTRNYQTTSRTALLTQYYKGTDQMVKYSIASENDVNK